MKMPIKVAVSVPKQALTLEDKLDWLYNAASGTDCDLLMTPQEFLGGHYVWQLARQDGQEMPLHVDRSWVVSAVGEIAKSTGVHIAVGACCNTPNSGATEDFLYIDPDGTLLGYHSKFALPSYDDMKTGGHGQLWPETNYRKRATPIAIPGLRLRVGTVFCWEVFSQSLWSSYSFDRVNLVCHPIKFSPTGWLKNKKLEDGKKHIVGFGNEPKSTIWRDRLIMASRHQVMCPIAISCNTWDLGSKFMALGGWVDEVAKKTDMNLLPSDRSTDWIKVYQFLPEWYEGLDHHHSAGAFKAHVGSVEGFSELGQWTMHSKIRRLEAHLIGDTTRLDCALKAAAQSRQKKQSVKRAFGSGMQSIKRVK